MKQILLLGFFLIFAYSCDCNCDGNDYDADDYKVTIVDKWSDLGRVSGYDAVETKYHMTITYTNLSETDGPCVRKMLEVTGNSYHKYEQGKTYVFKAGKYSEYEFGLAQSYKRIVEEKEAEARKLEKERNKYNKRKI